MPTALPYRLEQALERQRSRLLVGQHRKGDPHYSKDYAAKAYKLLRQYNATGNLEFLIDAANYCVLEYGYPLHPAAHFKATDSQGR